MTCALSQLVVFSVLLFHSHEGKPTDQPPMPPALTAEDKQFFESLLHDVLFDPREAIAVRIEVTRYSKGERNGKCARDGWLVKGKTGEGDQVIFTDGASVLAPKDVPRFDFIAKCRRRYSDDVQPKPADEDGLDITMIVIMGRNRAGLFGREEDLTLAAWLYRLGQEQLAAKALAAARAAAAYSPNAGQNPSNQILKFELRRNLAWQSFESLVCAYEIREDQDALRYGERLLKLYPDAAKNEHPQAQRLVLELQRRQKAGRFGQTPAKSLPSELARDPRKSLAWLIEALDEVDAQQIMQPGRVNLAEDWRVRELIKLGEQAVPALIDVVEKDNRLTRSVQFWRNFSRDRTVLSVREAAMVAVSSILRTKFFEAANTADNFTKQGEAAGKEMAKQLRHYWSDVAKIPFDEGMMRVLLDPQSSGAVCQQAAYNLANLGIQQTVETNVMSGSVRSQPIKPNLAVAKFKQPTAAEAILGALDRDKGRPAGQRRGSDDEEQVRVLTTYLSTLIDLDDKRIGPELVTRADGAQANLIRLEYARTAFRLGAPQALVALARDFEKAAIKFPPDPPKASQQDPAGDDLMALTGAFAEAPMPETELALYCLTYRNHRYRPIAVRALLSHHPEKSDNEKWYSHPSSVMILRQLLEDTTLTIAKFTIADGRVRHDLGNGRINAVEFDQSKLPAEWKGKEIEVQESVRERAMTHLSVLVVGLPEFHPLWPDSANRIHKAKQLLDRFKERLRSLPYRPERHKLGCSPFGSKQIPDLTPLDKPATALDVESGRAVFHLAGRGKREEIKLPVWVLLKTDANNDYAHRGLAVQAERGPDDRVTYGVIFLNSIRAVKADEIEKLEPVVQEEK